MRRAGSTSTEPAACASARSGTAAQSSPAPPPAAQRGRDATAITVDERERTIEEIGPERITAFIGEPVIGVGGMIPPPEGYWAGVQEVLRRHGILLVVDEVVTAFGRTGRW